MAQKENWGVASFIVTSSDGNTHKINVKGRARWAPQSLIAAGNSGCTPIDTPGPRWSAYTFLLRSMGVEIETITESHAGPFSGHHARYVLRCHVKRLTEGDVA